MLTNENLGTLLCGSSLAVLSFNGVCSEFHKANWYYFGILILPSLGS